MTLAFDSVSRSARPHGRGVRRILTVWFACLGLVVHLAAAGACTMDMPAHAGVGPFPICHAHGIADDGPAPAQDASHHDGCPFCAAHCHAAIALPQVVAVPTPLPVASIGPERLSLLSSTVPRCHAGASPRGPPRRA